MLNKLIGRTLGAGTPKTTILQTLHTYKQLYTIAKSKNIDFRFGAV